MPAGGAPSRADLPSPGPLGSQSNPATEHSGEFRYGDIGFSLGGPFDDAGYLAPSRAWILEMGEQLGVTQALLDAEQAAGIQFGLPTSEELPVAAEEAQVEADLAATVQPGPGEQARPAQVACYY